jgi:ATP-binding cassette subfamily B (MDR/TAP) protein 1
VLLLDEATSALDPNAEKIVQQALNNVAKGRTIVAIAHRLSTIRDADNIVVISKGEKVEEGTHDELIKLGGSYANLVQTQDLGRGDKNDGKDEDEEKVAEGAALEAAITSASGVVADQVVVSPEERDDISYGLFHCLWLVLKENRYLWIPFGLNMASCVAGGKSLNHVTKSQVDNR